MIPKGTIYNRIKLTISYASELYFCLLATQIYSSLLSTLCDIRVTHINFGALYATLLIHTSAIAYCNKENKSYLILNKKKCKHRLLELKRKMRQCQNKLISCNRETMPLVPLMFGETCGSFT